MFLVFQIDRGNLRVMITNTTSLTIKSMWWKTLMLFLQMSNPHVKKLYSMCLKTMRLWSKWSLKEGVLQWDTSPEPTGLLLIGCSIELIWTPRSKSNTSTPKTYSQTFWPKGNFTRDEWNHLLNLFNISHFSSTACTAAMANTSSTRIRRRTCHSQIATYDEFDREDAFGRVFFNFIKPGEDLVWISRSWKDLLQVTIDRGNLRKPSPSQVIHKRIMVNLGLLKSGKVELRELDRSGETWENFLGYICNKLTPHREEPLLGRKCAFRKVRRDYSRWIGETRVSASPRTESWITIERGNLCQRISHNRLILKISSWAVTQQNLWKK